jgi:amidase
VSDTSRPTGDQELTDFTACELARHLRRGDFSAVEVLEAHLAVIERTNPTINAICTLSEDRARADATAADKAHARGETLGSLHGLPILHKDLIDTAGVTTTYGSGLFREHRPDVDAVVVARASAAGAVMLGKTNTPQFGTGGHTSNKVFGVTVNPFDTTRSAGGSSGGSAAALAARMVPLATGTDMAGSLRIPAAFCNVVGMRPSPGRIPWWPSAMGHFPYVVMGPMARTVDDVALLLSATAGPDPRAILVIEETGARFTPPINGASSHLRVAWAPNIGRLAVAREVSEVLQQLGRIVVGLGAEVVEAEPDLAGADEAFRVWRAWYYATSYGDLLAEHPEEIDDSTAANVREGMGLSGEQLGRAELLRTSLIARVVEFFSEYDVLVMPSAPVAAFPADQWTPQSIDGSPLASYLDWMRHLYYLTVTGLPAISLPAGFTKHGLPVGVQIVGGPRRDLDVLRFARALEAATRFGERKPVVDVDGSCAESGSKARP